ncbi:YTH domain family protein 2 [Leucoagaricus sp. SymC.cos]|nr:YTH domain family protein 2 [Leucoagaricus sp. SymC.cos]
MSSQNYPIPPVPSSPPSSGGVRRHHTITAASRSARNAAKESISEETPDQSSIWNDDGPVDQDWVGGIGAVGEKTSLHRQASLPTRYNRGFHGSKSGTMTPKTINSLAAIAGHEGDEEPWNVSYDADEPSPQEPVESQSQSSTSPHSASTSPPPGANVRRHVSLTAAAGATRKITPGLRRSGTLQATLPHHHQSSTPSDAQQPEEEYSEEAEDQGAYDDYYNQNYPTSPMGRQSPWTPGSNGGQNNEWRNNTGFAPVPNQSTANAIDDVQRALSALEIASNNGTQVATQPVIESEGRKTPLGAGLPRGGGSAANASGSYYQNNNRPVGNGSSGNESIPSQLLTAPVDVPTLIATKGYNPPTFDVKPAFARYFVIKSYTEDDVHKSLKYEIWSSTDPGNKRLDKAFKETAGRGPIYLFFSVNARCSGHFCGMAEMITPVDYTRSSTVWASDKWKGVFKVRWIFVRDIPNATLRHIKLNNTQERKPVTNSRDTQELLPDAGQEMLRIFLTHPSRTSLLQDYAFYELQSLQRIQSQQGNSNANSPPQSATQSAVHSPQMQPAVPAAQQQNAFSMPYQIPAMMMAGYGQANSGMGYGYGQGGAGYGGQQAYGGQLSSQTQAMHQSVMRHPSPGPNQQGFF